MKNMDTVYVLIDLTSNVTIILLVSYNMDLWTILKAGRKRSDVLGITEHVLEKF